MSDLEMTKLCAEVMGIEWCAEPKDGTSGLACYLDPSMKSRDMSMRVYDPLRDDAQAMELVKKFKLIVCPIYEEDRFATWKVFKAWPEPETPDHWGADLNRAIVECVAKLQADKRP